jgi:hypothetical protein
MKMKKFTIKVILILLTTNLFWVPAATSVESYTSTPILICSADIKTNCVEKITASFSDGKEVEAVATGRSSVAECENVSGIKTSCTYLQMRVPGLKNEDGKDLIQVIGWIQPPNPDKLTNLPPGALLFFISSGGWDSPTKLLSSGKCSTRSSELNCRIGYSLEAGVKFTARIIAKDFTPAWTTGTLLNSKITYEKVAGNGVFTYQGEPGNAAGIISDPRNGGQPEQSNDYETNMWSIRTIDINDSSGTVLRSKGCGGLNPVMMTDAFWVGLPSFESASESISLSVNNPHLLSTGQPAAGRFEGVFSSAFTKCFWNKTAADASGRIQMEITYPGESPVLASLTSKLIQDGFQLNAAGYHYSSPTLKFFMKPAQAKPSAVSTKKSITCVKGKVTKKVTAVSPKCPIGYKKK